MLASRGFPGIRAAHGKIFENLGPGATVSELAERAQITKQSVADLVLGLERAGYLERVPHPTDGRAQLVRTTRKGARAVAAAQEVLRELVSAWRKDVGSARFDAAVAVLTEIARKYDADR